MALGTMTREMLIEMTYYQMDTDSRILEYLAKELPEKDNWFIFLNIARHPNTPLEILKDLIGRPGLDLITSVAVGNNYSQKLKEQNGTRTRR